MVRGRMRPAEPEAAAAEDNGLNLKALKEKKIGEKKEKAEQRAAYAKTHQKLSLKRGRG